MLTQPPLLKLGKTAALLSCLALAAAVTGCNNNNNAGGISTPEAFVNKLVELSKNGTIPAGYQGSDLAKTQANQPGYFVIWDAQDGKYMAVNLNTYNQGTLDQAVGQFVMNDQQNPANAGVLVTPDGKDAGGNPLYISSNGTVYSHDSQTKDVDLQRAQIENLSLLKTAAAISSTFQMSFDSAVKVATLADKVQSLSAAQGQFTQEDRDAISANLAGIAGLTPQEANTLITQSVTGNTAAVNPLLEKAAKNLGMPSAETLRDRMLAPAGLSIGN